MKTKCRMTCRYIRAAAVTVALILFLLTSCNGIRIIEIQAYNPAAITFPSDVRTVMIVNNSAQQPDYIGHSFVSANGVDSVMRISCDSAAYDFCQALGRAIAESPRFDDVRICDDTLRRDSAFYEALPFNPEDVSALCERYDVDALISLDKFVLGSRYVRQSDAHTYLASLVGEIRVAWPGLKTVYTVPFVDSLKWNLNWIDEDVFGRKLRNYTLADAKAALHYLAETVAWDLRVNIIPYWSGQHRWYYTNLSSEWKRAAILIKAEKWAEAAEVWQQLLDKSKKWKERAQLSSNAALCYEMNGDFRRAVELAEQTYRLYKENLGDENDYTKIHAGYLNTLKIRLENDNKLSEQLGESQ